jgi:hypothetical protein
VEITPKWTFGSLNGGLVLGRAYLMKKV